MRISQGLASDAEPKKRRKLGEESKTSEDKGNEEDLPRKEDLVREKGSGEKRAVREIKRPRQERPRNAIRK